mmetsp:Transcript_38395/g.90815  ORF Transcript_38395/g.90815 Transcript_38395/m.90815 type:complete len:283 (+) Transcript_38395:40-888(+)
MLLRRCPIEGFERGLEALRELLLLLDAAPLPCEGLGGEVEDASENVAPKRLGKLLLVFDHVREAPLQAELDGEVGHVPRDLARQLLHPLGVDDLLVLRVPFILALRESFLEVHGRVRGLGPREGHAFEVGVRHLAQVHRCLKEHAVLVLFVEHAEQALFEVAHLLQRVLVTLDRRHSEGLRNDEAVSVRQASARLKHQVRARPRRDEHVFGEARVVQAEPVLVVQRLRLVVGLDLLLARTRLESGHLLLLVARLEGFQRVAQPASILLLLAVDVAVRAAFLL